MAMIGGVAAAAPPSSNTDLVGSPTAIKMAGFAQGDEVVGGVLVADAPPWIVALNDDDRGTFCTGMLVSRTAVLTAEHCTTSRNFSIDDVRIGSTRGDSGGLVRNIDSVEVAPNGEDAALLVLSSAVPATHELATVSIDPAHSEQGADVRYMGFGGDDDGNLGRLIRTLDDDFSVNNNGNNRRCEDLPWICFDQLGDSFPVGGDSGGPWMHEDNGWKVIAVHFGATNPEVGTRTTELADWLGNRVTQYAGPECGGLPATIVGTGGPITGTANDDVIVGTNASETIRGGGGNDTICGLGGHDTILGHGGDDTLYGGPGNDTIYGGDGNDNLQGVSGNDKLHGQNGDDLVFGQVGSDLMTGGEGVDEMYGSSGNDTMYGGGGNDLVYGGGGNDSLLGNDGDDLLFGQNGDDKMWGYAGNDTLYGAAGDDRLKGGDGDDSLQAAGGNDFLYGENGADKLYGQAGNDYLNGGLAVDECWPGSGTDRQTLCP